MPKQDIPADLDCWMDPPKKSDFPRRIFIEGLIGAGKSCFAKELSKITGYKLLEEPVEENPFLELYYKDMVRYGFSMQVYLLTVRLSLERAGVYMVQSGIEEGVIGDRSLGGDTVFLKTNARLGNISLSEYRLYFQLFNQMKIECPYPDVIIYLDVPMEIIRNRIEERGRECEKGLLEPTNPYLAMIGEEYKHYCEAMTRHTYVASVDWSDYTCSVEKVWQQVCQGWRASSHSRFQNVLLKW